MIQSWFTVLYLLSSAISFRSFGNATPSSNRSAKIQKVTAIGMSCHDGDTCRVKTTTGEIWKIRLSGIDAPEIKQPFGVEAQNHLEKLIKDQKVQMECTGMSFDRHTCRIFLKEKDLGEEMVKEGLAWEAPQYSKINMPELWQWQKLTARVFGEIPRPLYLPIVSANPLQSIAKRAKTICPRERTWHHFPI